MLTYLCALHKLLNLYIDSTQNLLETLYRSRLCQLKTAVIIHCTSVLCSKLWKEDIDLSFFLNKSHSIKLQLTNRLTDIIERFSWFPLSYILTIYTQNKAFDLNPSGNFESIVVFHLSINLSQSKSSPLPKLE